MPKRLKCFYYNQERVMIGDKVLYKRVVYTIKKYKNNLLKIVDGNRFERVRPFEVALLCRETLDVDRFNKAKENVYLTILQDPILFEAYTRIISMMEKPQNDFNRDVLLDALWSIEDRAIATNYML